MVAVNYGTLLEVVFGLLVAGVVGRFAVRLISRRALQRGEVYNNSGILNVPCRLSWPEGMNRRGSHYGRLVSSDDSLTFRGRRGTNVKVPLRCSVHVKPSWRSGNSVVTLTTSIRGNVVILLSDKDAELLQYCYGRL